MLTSISHTLTRLQVLLIGLFLVQANCETAAFDAREATISSVHQALFSGSNTCRDIVSAFLARIERFNPLINAIITLDNRALDTADLLDEQLRRGNASSTLFCVPILIKDNFDVSGLPTTAGCLALNSSVPTKDAPVVAALRQAGAVILGKVNLHEFALEGLSTSSLGGQTLNPYDLSRTPGGSSGGTGAAVAASFAVLGTGTDTVNSLRNPASANSLFSFRPTRGLISRAGVIPVSHTQDTVGAIGRSLLDIATVLSVMSSCGPDLSDNVTTARTHLRGNLSYENFVAHEYKFPLLRVGVLYPFFNSTNSNETAPVNKLVENVVARLGLQNITFVPLNNSNIYSTFDPARILGLDVQQYEYREQLTSYLSSQRLSGSHPQSMEEIYLNTSQYFVIPHQYGYIQNALGSSTSSREYHSRMDQIQELTVDLRSVFESNNIDAIIYPEQRNLVVPLGSPNQSGRNGILAALTGSPVITIPIGFSNATESAPIGVPVGMEILGLPWSEGRLLSIAKRIDDSLHARRAPVTAGMNEIAEVPYRYDKVPIVQPQGLIHAELALSRSGVLKTNRLASSEELYESRLLAIDKENMTSVDIRMDQKPSLLHGEL